MTSFRHNGRKINRQMCISGAEYQSEHIPKCQVKSLRSSVKRAGYKSFCHMCLHLTLESGILETN